MRALIEQRLEERADEEETADERWCSGWLEQIAGEPSAELLDLLERPTRRAAVLLGLVERPAGLTVLFTERAPHLSHHPGQVSFPGGRLEDDEEPIVGALREAAEEVGLAPEDVSVAGCLGRYVTITSFAVTPVVGFIRGTWQARPDPGEVSGVFEVPLKFLLERGNRHLSYRERFGTRFKVYEFRFQGHTIWGATAAMLVEFFEMILDEKTT